jgi:Phosphotransferase enzyme family
MSGPEVLPTTLEAVLDPEWLSQVLNDVEVTERVVDVRQVDSSQTLAQKVRFVATIESSDGTRRTRPYCIKAHLDGSPGGTLMAEALFYRDLSERLEVRTPRAYYAGVDDLGSAIIIMDDVVANGGHFLNAMTPYSLETTRDSLSQLARLHAPTWGFELVRDLDFLAPRAAAMADAFPVDALQALLDDGRGPDVAPELRDASNLIEAVKRTGAHELTCVLHGDTHSGNSYLDADGRACWLDWQVVQKGNWATDISYHLATVLDVETRRSHEADLLRYYLDELQSLGAPAPSWDEAWDHYTLSFSYGYFLWVITRISSREVVLIHIPRLATALSDHDTFRRLGVV